MTNRAGRLAVLVGCFGFLSSSAVASGVGQTYDFDGAMPISPILEQIRAGEGAEPVPDAGPGVPVRTLYAAPLLQGAKNEHVRVVALDDQGDRAILERVAGGAFGLFAGKTTVTLLERRGDGWNERALLSRSNGKWIGGVSLSALAYSGDGRYLVFSRLRDVDDYKSLALMVLDLQTGRDVELAPWTRSLNEDSALAHVLPQTPWYQATFPGQRYEEAFPDSKTRCAGKTDIKAGVSSRSFAPDVPQKSFVVQKAGAVSFVYPLKELPETQAWDWQNGDWLRSFSKDCTRGLATVEELLETGGYSFFYGRNASDAHMRIMEFGIR